MSNEAVIIFGVVAGLAAIGLLVALWYWLEDRRRREALSRLAQEQGWRYQDVEGRPDLRYQGFEPFRGWGSSSRARHLMAGEYKGRSFELLQYQYTVSTGKSSHTYYFRVCSYGMPVPAPGLTIKPEHVGLKILDKLGDNDIDFESAAFSRRHWVTCPDRRFAYDVLDARMQHWLMEEPPRVWQWRGDRMVLVEKGYLAPALAMRLLDAAVGFRRRVPRHLMETRL